MLIEAIYRDGHKEKIICGPETLLSEVVKVACDQHPLSSIKCVKVIANDRDCQRVDR